MKVLFIMLIVVLLVAFAVPVFANKDGVPNANAWFGQVHKTFTGSVVIDVLKQDALAHFMNVGQVIKIIK